MKIHGLQKMTLLDYPGKVACTVFFGGCNMRCPFCHNALLVTQVEDGGTITDTDVLDFLKTRQGLLDGVGITGGEPLLQPEIIPFAEKIKELGYSVKIDTNGTRPQVLKELVSKKLVDYVAVDIKNRKEKYAKTVDIENFDIKPVEETVEFLLSGAVDYEFRTTVVKNFHSVEDITAICEWIKGARRYFLQNFVDSGNLIGKNMQGASPRRYEKNVRSGAKNYSKYLFTRHLGHI